MSIRAAKWLHIPTQKPFAAGKGLLAKAKDLFPPHSPLLSRQKPLSLERIGPKARPIPKPLSPTQDKSHPKIFHRRGLTSHSLVHYHMYIIAVCLEVLARLASSRETLGSYRPQGSAVKLGVEPRGGGLTDGAGSLTNDVPEGTGAGPFPLALLYSGGRRCGSLSSRASPLLALKHDRAKGRRTRTIPTLSPSQISQSRVIAKGHRIGR
jgi:hypothetical protein